MSRAGVISVLAGVVLLVLVSWVVRNTYWVDTQVRMPPKGEALTNPFYAAQRFAEALGARTEWDRAFIAAPADSVIVLSGWHWNLTASRPRALELWVMSGGRLVVDRTLTGVSEFEKWSGIVREHKEPDEAKGDTGSGDQVCRSFEAETGAPASAPYTVRYTMCGFDTASSLTSNRKAAWALRDASRTTAMRVQMGQGSVTVVNATPFRDRGLLDGDHGWLFVAATELRHGDHVRFLSDDGQPSLLALAWRHGGPVVVLTLTLVVLVLWRGGVRFGPAAAETPKGRRSLAEQIRGTGRFAWRHGNGSSLHAAAVRALDEAARRRVPGYARLSAHQRANQFARLTGGSGEVINAAIHNPHLRGVYSAIALLEAARRRIIIDPTRSSHGTC
jgi:hypothetical protein